MFFVDTDVGDVIECSEEEAEQFRQSPLRYLEVPAWEFLSPPEFSAPDVEIEDRSWVIDWYLRRKTEIEARIKARKESYAAALAEDNSALRCLDWRYFDEVKALAVGLLKAQKGKKKSVNTTFGKVGWRKDTKTVIEDDETVIEWLLEQDECHPAVKLTPSILKKQLPAGEIPGVKRPSGDVFFANPAKG